MAEILRRGASQDTWRLRSQQLVDWSDPQRLQHLERHLAERTAAVAPGTVRKDISTMKWQLERQLPAHEVAPLAALLLDLQAGLRREEATAPVTKAVPITMAELEAVVKRAEPPVQLLALLAYRTASRVGDLMFLGPRNFRVISTKTLFVSFGITKTNPDADNRVDHHVEIDDAKALITLLRALKPTTVTHPALQVELQVFFTNKHRSTLERLLAAFPLTKRRRQYWQQLRPESELLTTYSLHSIKRGAAHRLWAAAAAGKMTPQTVMSMLKHKQLDTTLGYAPDQRLVARAMGTPFATLVTRE